MFKNGSGHPGADALVAASTRDVTAVLGIWVYPDIVSPLALGSLEIYFLETGGRQDFGCFSDCSGERSRPRARLTQ